MSAMHQTLESFDIESLFWYAGKLTSSKRSGQVRISRSCGQGQDLDHRSKKSEFSSRYRLSVTDIGPSHCNCSDDKSHFIHSGMMQPVYSHANSAEGDVAEGGWSTWAWSGGWALTYWLSIKACLHTRLRVVCLRLKGNLVTIISRTQAWTGHCAMAQAPLPSMNTGTPSKKMKCFEGTCPPPLKML